jgi:HAMP domain-containing protein
MVAVQAGHHEALVLAQSLEPTDRMLERLGLVLLLFGLAGVVGAGLAGWGVATNGLRPVRRLTGAVEEIARTERLDPIPVEGSDEIARLSTAFNQMLAALSASRTRQRELVADAGHELRTPLTSLRTNLDLLVQSEGSLPAGQRRELLDDVGAQITEDAGTQRTPQIGEVEHPYRRQRTRGVAHDPGAPRSWSPARCGPPVGSGKTSRCNGGPPGRPAPREDGRWYVEGTCGVVAGDLDRRAGRRGSRVPRRDRAVARRERRAVRVG